MSHLRPFLSLSMIILSLFVVVFFHMEERRMGYSLLKQKSHHKRVLEQLRRREIQLAKLSRPQRLDKMAQSKLTLKKAHSSQIIYLTDQLLVGAL